MHESWKELNKKLDEATNHEISTKSIDELIDEAYKRYNARKNGTLEESNTLYELLLEGVKSPLSPYSLDELTQALIKRFEYEKAHDEAI